MSGTRSWPPGPSKVDRTLDLADLECGPLRSGATLDEVNPTDDAGFDPRIRLGEGSYATARTVTEERITAAFGQPGSEDREKAAMISWYRRDDVIFVDLSDNGKIVGIGFF